MSLLQPGSQLFNPSGFIELSKAIDPMRFSPLIRCRCAVVKLNLNYNLVYFRMSTTLLWMADLKEFCIFLILRPSIELYSNSTSQSDQ